MDLRGHGDSEAPATGYSVSTMADDVMEILNTKGVRDFVLIGHSMGGKVALSLASQQPDGLQSLILLAPSPLCQNLFLTLIEPICLKITASRMPQSKQLPKSRSDHSLKK
ncbi:alpha/beta hydrolase [Spirosoma telluris]|uniref:alpha/beta fold hydrolase n=1 Tax=Spirosoma telluris TaxID=2183553 RepID=UPI002FC336AF